MSNPEEAEKKFTQAIELIPKSVYAYHHHCYLYYIMANYDLALKDANVLIQLKSNYYVGYTLHSAIYQSLKLFDLA